jgi:thymidylate kinase
LKQYSIGLHVAISGPDGVGKSTVSERVFDLIDDHFAGIETSHLSTRTPRRKAVGIGTAPYAKPPRGWLGSLAKVVYMMYGYHRLFWRGVRPHKRTGGIFWSDRYFTDLLADPARFRVQLPQWFLRLAWQLVPKPDLNLILVAVPDTIQERCDEIDLEQTRAQVQAYELLLAQSDQFIRIDAGLSIEDSSALICRMIMDRLSWASKAHQCFL